MRSVEQIVREFDTLSATDGSLVTVDIEEFKSLIDVVRTSFVPAVTELIVDPKRNEKFVDATGIYVRAKFEEVWGNYDIAQLDSASLRAWLRSRGGKNHWAESTLGTLLSHPLWPED